MRYDELAHWGILGMKWGVRRYQNEDGSLTPLGREHYGVGPAGKTIGSAGKAAAKIGKTVGKGALTVGKAVGKEALVVGKNVARKHIPKVFMSDEQLQSSIARADAERRFYQAKKDAVNLKKSKGREVLGKILTSGVEELGRRAFGKLGDKIFKDRLNYQYYLDNPDKIRDKDTAEKIKAYKQALKALDDEESIKDLLTKLTYEQNVYKFEKTKRDDAEEQAKRDAEDAKEAGKNRVDRQRTKNRNEAMGLHEKRSSGRGWGTVKPSVFVNLPAYEKGSNVVSNSLSEWSDYYRFYD